MIECKSLIIGVAASLDSHSRSADYTEAGRLTVELVTAIADAPRLAATLRGRVLNLNVPNMSRASIKGVKLNQPGVSCTQPDWVRVAKPGAVRDGHGRETLELSQSRAGDTRCARKLASESPSRRPPLSMTPETALRGPSRRAVA